jgi:hypothetical protein
MSQAVTPSEEEKFPSSEVVGSSDVVREDAKPCEDESMGDTGLEPVTPSVSCWCASQLRQSPASIDDSCCSNHRQVKFAIGSGSL